MATAVPDPRGGATDRAGMPLSVDRGLDSAGFIRSEVALDRVAAPYLAVVEQFREACRSALGEDLHSLYLCGSLVKGTAQPGVSDLDALAVLRVAPEERHEVIEREVSHAIEERHGFLSGASFGLCHRDVIVSRGQRYDMGFFVKCLCVCIDGDDLDRQLPRYRPSLALARGTNGNIRRLVDDRRVRVAEAESAAEVAFVCRGIMRKIVRTGFTLVMPRYRGWTSELEPSVAIFGAYYPEQGEAMRGALALARMPSGDRLVVLDVLDSLGVWLADEYDRVIMSQGRRRSSGVS